MDHVSCERIERATREVLAVTIGFAVLGLNRVQVQRRRLAASMTCESTTRRTAD